LDAEGTQQVICSNFELMNLVFGLVFMVQTNTVDQAGTTPPSLETIKLIKLQTRTANLQKTNLVAGASSIG